MKRIPHLAALWLPVIAYGGVVYYLSSLPQVGVAGRVPDYLTHPVEYAGLTILIIRALNGGLKGSIPGRVHCWGVALAFLYAVSDEIHQLHVPHRSSSLKDVLSDTLGAVVAVGVAEVLQRTSRQREPPALEVTLYLRKNCHLCHDARDILQRVAREIPLAVTEVDVDTSSELLRQFGSQVPVIMASGKKISKLRPSGEAIRRRLARMTSRAS